MTSPRPRATRTEAPEPIRPIVRRVVVEIARECEPWAAFIEDPYVRSLWGEPVES